MMYKFVILSAAVALCAAQGPYDTPEVAQARAAHLAAFAEAQARNLGGPVFPQQVAPNPVFTPAPVFNPAPVFTSSPTWKVWDGVPAPIVVMNGNILDTAEVAAEKAKHFHLVADAALRSAASGPNDDGKYRVDASGQYIPSVTAPVYQSSGFPGTSFPSTGFPTHGFPAPNPNVPLPYQYAQTPVVVAHGHVQDTPEVAALKNARLAELRAAGAAV